MKPDFSSKRRWLLKLVDGRASWLGMLRLRAFAWLLAIGLAAVATLMLTTVSWVPVIGVAVAMAVVSLNTIASKLNRATCFSCGKDLSTLPLGPAGIACPRCGALHQPRPDNTAPSVDLADHTPDTNPDIASDVAPDLSPSLTPSKPSTSTATATTAPATPDDTVA